MLRYFAGDLPTTTVWKECRDLPIASGLYSIIWATVWLLPDPATLPCHWERTLFPRTVGHIFVHDFKYLVRHNTAVRKDWRMIGLLRLVYPSLCGMVALGWRCSIEKEADAHPYYVVTPKYKHNLCNAILYRRNLNEIATAHQMASSEIAGWTKELDTYSVKSDRRVVCTVDKSWG